MTTTRNGQAHDKALEARVLAIALHFAGHRELAVAELNPDDFHSPAHGTVFAAIAKLHRSAGESFDISADLMELARTPVAVVCAGAKSILDIGLTLEVLETQGVPVVSVGQDNFAAFYTQDSGFKADFRIDAPADIARFIRTKWALGLDGGVVVSNPVPADQAMPREQIEKITRQALAECGQQGIAGKAVTPFLLARIKALTGGASLATNIALVKNNARLGARLALSMR